MKGIDWRWVSALNETDFNAMTFLAVKQYYAQSLHWQKLRVDWNTPRPETIHKFMATYVKQAAIKIMIRTKDGVMIGFVLLSLERTDKGQVCHIDEMFIDEAYRNKGIGTKTLIKIKRHAEKQNIAGLTLNVSAANPARGLYERMGFEPVQIKYQMRLD
ncbi:acetyltransferase [Erwinia phage AH06]|nr:acetyltransferase [Erwinia phage AH06]